MIIDSHRVPRKKNIQKYFSLSLCQWWHLVMKQRGVFARTLMSVYTVKTQNISSHQLRSLACCSFYNLTRCHTHTHTHPLIMVTSKSVLCQFTVVFTSKMKSLCHCLSSRTLQAFRLLIGPEVRFHPWTWIHGTDVSQVLCLVTCLLKNSHTFPSY